MDLYTQKKISPVGKVNSEDLKRWGNNLLMFLIPLGIMYLLQLNAMLQNGTLKAGDFIPNQTTIGGMQLYVINGLLDLLKKFMDGKK